MTGDVRPSTYVCPNRACRIVDATGRPHRTPIGTRYGESLLVVRATVGQRVSPQRTELTCPSCGLIIFWAGAVAVIVEPMAA